MNPLAWIPVAIAVLEAIRENWKEKPVTAGETR